MAETRAAYAAAGVDVEAGERAVELMRAAVAATRRPEVLEDIGGFGSAVALPSGYRDPVLVSSTDGVGTKTAIASAVGRFDTIGLDLVAMCVDDVVCSGAEPLWMLDYLAVGRLVPERVAEIVGGVADGCRQAGCALVGGETAEHPGLMEPDQFDLAGFCVGIVERERRLDGTRARAGDAIVGLASAGLHANGFSLVRELVRARDLDLRVPFREILARWLPGSAITRESDDRFLGQVLLTPTTIYAPAIRTLVERVDVRGLAHITGGGLPGNVPRALRPGLGARLDPRRWPIPSVIRLFGHLGDLADRELRATFNGGLGMVAVVPPADVVPAIEVLAGAGIEAWEVGRVEPVDALGGARYLEAAIE
jgi:phosphoribosylformylglycinamidine cyclo-ligase